jgi:hypothetical protein
MQVELLDRHRWRTRIELANAIFEYLELFHNCTRRHSSIGMLTRYSSRTPSPWHENPTTRLHETRGTAKLQESRSGSERPFRSLWRGVRLGSMSAWGAIWSG